MKNLKAFYFVFVLGTLLLSCAKDGASLLDQGDSGNLTEAQVFASAKYTKEFLTDIYRRLPYGWDDNVYLDAATDDGESRPAWGWVNPVQIGAYNPTSLPDKLKRWANYYAAIRSCNLFLSKIDAVPLDADQYINTDVIKNRMKYEAICLRALFYTELVRFYGGVPIITKVLTFDSPELYNKRANLKEMKEFIVGQCDSAAANLPAIEPGTDYMRVTSGVAKAIKARLLLHLASPLFNTATPVLGQAGLTPWGWGDYTASRWKEAADAAKAVIDHADNGNTIYSLVLRTEAANYFGTNTTYPGSLKAMGFYSVFITKVNSEIMLSYGKKNLTNEIDKWQLPGYMQKDGDKSYTLPTYNYAASFETKDGVPVYQTDEYGVPLLDANSQFIVNPASGFDPQQPYVNRDSRFYHSLWYNGAKFGGATFNTWRGEDGSYGTEYLNGFAHTGLFLRKFMDPKNLSLNNGVTGQTSHNFPIYRFAEFLLDYAEASNEYLPDGASRMEAISALDKLRARADMPSVAATFSKNAWNTTDKNRMRKFIQNERRVELSFEEQRYFDIRRWLIAEKTQKVVYEHDVVRKPNGSFVYSIRVWERRSFEAKNYLLPIPQTEINNNVNMQQNPGW